MSDNIIEMFKKTKAILTDDHFVYTSGKHGSVYVNKDLLYPHPTVMNKVGKMFAEKFKNEDIDVVAAPALGGIILTTWTAYHLSKMKKKEILNVCTEKDKGTTADAAESQQIFRRGYGEFVKGKKVLVLEDLTTTGISVKKTVEAVRSAGGKVVAVCIMVNRDPVHITSKTIGAPFYSLGVFPAEAFDEKDCPLCKKGVPINTTVGHGKKYIEAKKGSV